ncbi:MAG: response regulator transcription factor [Candidatus Omnitrophica bacterium]|nr:response regulator transcription factor [Candidatus Omnitrophota bacterium]
MVEDDKELAKLISFHMNIAGYEALFAKDGVEALESCRHDKPDLVILDIMLPRIDGWQVCRQLRRDNQTSHIPIIIVSALSEVNDRLKGFDLGSDDYVTKPFSPRELTVRVKRILARAETRTLQPKTARIGPFKIDLEEMRVERNNKEILFSEREKGILKLFIHNPGRVLSHSEILDKVWGQDNIVEYGNIDVHIRHLREKLEKDPENPMFIKTVKGEGYKLEPSRT